MQKTIKTIKKFIFISLDSLLFGITLNLMDSFGIDISGIVSNWIQSGVENRKEKYEEIIERVGVIHFIYLLLLLLGVNVNKSTAKKVVLGTCNVKESVNNG